MSSHASDLSKTEEKLKDNSAIEALMEERWLEARKKVEKKILRKKKEAKEKEAAEAKQIADEEAKLQEVKQITSETEVEKAATSMIFSWLKMFLGTVAGAGMLYALWWKYCRSKIGSDATGARASVMTSVKANDGNGNKVDSSTRPSGGNVFNSKQTNYGRPSTIDTSTTVGAVAGAAIMKQTTIKQQIQKGQRQRKWKQNLVSVDANSNHGSVNATAFDPEDANKKMWDERRKKLQEKKLEAISKAEQQGKAAEEAMKKEKATAEAKRVADEAAKQQKRLEAIKKVEKRKQSEHNRRVAK